MGLFSASLVCLCCCAPTVHAHSAVCIDSLGFPTHELRAQTDALVGSAGIPTVANAFWHAVQGLVGLKPPTVVHQILKNIKGVLVPVGVQGWGLGCACLPMMAHTKACVAHCTASHVEWQLGGCPKFAVMHQCLAQPHA